MNFPIFEHQLNTMNTHLPRPVPVSRSCRPAGLLACWLSTLLICGFHAWLPAARAASSPPDFMTYQGFLVDGNGNPLATNAPANYPVIFRIYSAATGAAGRLWSEQQIVTVDKGNFSVVLGEGTPVGGENKPTLSSVFTGATASDRYISISVTISGSTLEILPRLRLLPSAYAFLATSAANIVTPAGSNAISYANNRLEIDGAMRISGGAQPALTLDSASATGTWLALGNSSAGGRYWQMISSGSGNGEGAGKLLIGSGSSAGSTGIRMTLQDNGNVGIGTSTPNAPLSFGGGLANTKLALWDGGPGSAYGFGIQPGQFRFHVNNASDRFSFLNGVGGAEIMTIQGSGGVGIGTIPTARFDVLSSTGSRLRVFDFGGGAGSQLVGGWAANSPFGPQVRYERVGAPGFWDQGMVNGDFVIEESDIPRLTLRAGGNVGIGTTTPTSLLQIGTVNATGDAFLRMESVGGNQAANGIKLRNFNDEHGWDIINEERGGTGLQANGFHIVRHFSSAVGTTAFFIDKFAGNIGVQTTAPADRLHLRGGVFRIDDGGGEYIRMYRSAGGLIIEGNGMGNPGQAGGFGTIQWDGDGNWDSFSDRRLKKDITDAEPVLSRLMQLPVRRYLWNESSEEDSKKFGVIAQEVQPLFPESVGSMMRAGETNELLTVKYGTFGLIAVKALQELKAEKDTERAAFQKEIAALKKEIDRLNGKIADAARIEALEQQLNDFKKVVQRLASGPAGDGQAGRQASGPVEETTAAVR